MGRLTTHVLDTARGRPGAGIAVRLYSLASKPANKPGNNAADDRELVADAVTNADGRTDEPLLDDGALRTGAYELEFAVGAYFAAAGVTQDEPPFLDDVVIRVRLRDDQHYHVPLLVSPWSYSTYRGS